MTHIVGFSIQDLNNFYSYDDCKVNGGMQDLLILYGENGSGKTTILNLIYHILSGKPGSGHLNGIAKIPFKSLKITLSNHAVVEATRSEGTQSIPICFKVTNVDKKIVEYNFIPEKQRDKYFQNIFENKLSRVFNETKKSQNKSIDLLYNVVQSKNTAVYHADDAAHEKYLVALNSLGINCYFIAADRRIKSDALDERLTFSLNSIELERRDDDVISKVRVQYLKDALSGAARCINRQVIKASNAGTKDTNNIFIELLRRIEADNDMICVKDDDWDIQLSSSLVKLEKLNKSNKRLSKIGIAPGFDVDVIASIVKSSGSSQKSFIYTILNHYIDSLTARLRALEPIGNTIQTFIRLLNSLLSYKRIAFSPLDGFVIEGMENSPLDVEKLSSGEQQLLLMFCYLLISNEQQSIFIIDEPEISLNIKWQRKLIDAMKKLTEISGTQIILATHSIELLTQYSEMVVDLEPRINKKITDKNGNSEENN